MKKLFILAALLMATTSAHAGGISFEIEGQRIRIEAPRNCDSLSCLKITAPGFKGFKSKRFDDDDDADLSRRPPRRSRLTRRSAAGEICAGSGSGRAAQAAAPVASRHRRPRAGDHGCVRRAGANRCRAPLLLPVAAAPAPQPAPVAAAPASDPNSPLGVWATEENKGNVRIEPCGANLCGYSVKTNEKILISMKPTGSKWTGQIHDPDSGRNYDSTIALKGTNALRVQGCAFGGMFCGGQTWKRVS